MAVSPIQPGTVIAIKPAQDKPEATSGGEAAKESASVGSTTDLSLQNARKGSLLYQVVSKLITDEEQSVSDDQIASTAVFDRFLSSRLTNNESFMASMNSDPNELSSQKNLIEPVNNVIQIAAYQESGKEEDIGIGGLLDITQDN